MSKHLSLTMLFAVTALVAGCGGSGSGPSSPAPPPTSPPPTPADLHDAAIAQLTSVATPATGSLQLQWLDTFPAGSSYSVESQGADGRYTSIATVPGRGGHSEDMIWQHPLGALAHMRVQAHVQDRTLPLQTPSHADSLEIVIPARVPGIVLDQTDPVTGNVHVSLDDRATYLSVTWAQDAQPFATVNTRGASTTWATSPLPNGPHDLSARIETAPDARVEVARDVAVSNSGVGVAALLWGEADVTYVDVVAYGNGIASVSGSLDGADPVVLDAPNSCGEHGCAPGHGYAYYEFAFDDAAYPGPHTLEVSAVDSGGIEQKLGVPFVIYATSFTPADGAIVYGTLELSGTVVAGGAPVVGARLDDKVFLEGASSPFSGSLDLSTVLPGEHDLVVEVDDFERQHADDAHTVIVASSPSFVHAPVATLGRNTRMLAAEGDWLLYASGDGEHLLDAAIGTDVLLAGSLTLAGAADWQIDGDRVFASGTGDDCLDTCIYAWTPDGARANISENDPVTASPHVGPRARDGAVVWLNPGAASLTVYDVASASYTTVGADDSVCLEEGAGQYDIGSYGGTLHVYFSGAPDCWFLTAGIYEWSGGTHLQFLTGANCDGPRFDGIRLACRDFYTYDHHLFAIWLDDLHEDSLGAPYHDSIVARDGVIAWQEGSNIVKASDSAGTIATLTQTVVKPAMLYGTASGGVAFANDQGLTTWSSADGENTLRLDIQPNQVVVGEDALYFTVALSNVLYKIPLP